MKTQPSINPGKRRLATAIADGAPLEEHADGEALTDEKWWRDLFDALAELAGGALPMADLLAKLARSQMRSNRKATHALLRPLTDSLMEHSQLGVARALCGEMAARFPRSVPARLRYGRLLFWSGHLQAARQELAGLARMNSSALTHGGFIQCALAFRAWPLLADLRDALRANPSANSSSATQLQTVEAVLRLPRQGNNRTPCEILCISLDRDSHRFHSVQAAFRDIGLTVDRHSGVFGLSVPLLARRAILPPAMAPHTTGCTLSHIAAWERVASADGGLSLILEDDGLPGYDFDLDELITALPSDIDLCFVHETLAPDWPRSAAGVDQTVGIDHAWRSIPQSLRAPGAFGYILSHRGAKKLLDIAAACGVGIDIDWFLCAVTLDPSGATSEGHADRIICHVQAAVGPRPPFVARVARVPRIAHRPLGFFPRKHFAPPEPLPASVID